MNNSIGKNVHWTITGFMTQKLKLKGVELNIYALINSFSQSQQGEFYGSISWLQDLLTVSRPAVIDALASLYSKQLIIKINRGHNKNHYRINEQIIQNMSNNIESQIEPKLVKTENKSSINDKNIAEILYNCNENLLINITEEVASGSKESLPLIVKKVYQSSKETLPPLVKKVYQSSKETLLSSLYIFKLYLNNNKFIFKAINKLSFKDFEKSLALKLSELTGQTFLSPNKVIKRYSDLTKAFFESTFDFNNCISEAFEKAKQGDANYRQYNFVKALLIFLREGGEGISSYQTIYKQIEILENKIKKQLEDEKLESAELMKKKIDQEQLDAEAKELNLNIAEYQKLLTETYKHNVLHGNTFDMKEFICHLDKKNIDYKEYLKEKMNDGKKGV